MSTTAARTPIAAPRAAVLPYSTAPTAVAKLALVRDRAVRVADLANNVKPTTPKFVQDNAKATAVFRAFTSGSHNNTAQSDLRRAATGQTSAKPAPKRAAEVLDLTNSVDAPVRAAGNSSAPPTKKAKSSHLNAAAVTAAATLVTDSVTRRKLRREKEKVAQNEKMTADSITWRQKYKKAFPSFVFYFDSFDATVESGLVNAVERLGATVDNFFSKKVTHVVTTRAVPTGGPHNKENTSAPSLGSLSKPSVPTPSFYGSVSFLESAAGPARTKKSLSKSKKSPVNHGKSDSQKSRQFGDHNPFIDTQDILSKASEFGLKIWRLDKAQKIIARINSHSPTKCDPPIVRNQSLPSLLRDEQLFGTRERDPFVPRPDTHYFPTKSMYVLVEDSTGTHRPIAMKQYDRPRKGEDPSWPVLWGGVEGRGGFYHYQGPRIIYPRQAPPPIAAPIAVPKKQQPGFMTVRAGAPNLRRSASLNQLRKNQTADPALSKVGEPYMAASGNSQIITSNIASGTSTRSGAPAGFGNQNGIVDKRLAILSRQVVTLGGMKGVNEQGNLKRSASLDAGLNGKLPPPREEVKKPGYCENCRVKYDDFRHHIISRRHRKFARDPANWVILDQLLRLTERPLRIKPASTSLSRQTLDDSGFFDFTIPVRYSSPLEEHEGDSEDENFTAEQNVMRRAQIAGDVAADRETDRRHAAGEPEPVKTGVGFVWVRPTKRVDPAPEVDAIVPAISPPRWNGHIISSEKDWSIPIAHLLKPTVA